jgi:hypothetical protein
MDEQSRTTNSRVPNEGDYFPIAILGRLKTKAVNRFYHSRAHDVDPRAHTAFTPVLTSCDSFVIPLPSTHGPGVARQAAGLNVSLIDPTAREKCQSADAFL